MLCPNCAISSAISKTVEVVYNNIKLNIDGTEITPKDANGNVVEPFNFNGTVYLPVRAVGEALGKDVSWDDIVKPIENSRRVRLRKHRNLSTPNAVFV